MNRDFRHIHPQGYKAGFWPVDSINKYQPRCRGMVLPLLLVVIGILVLVVGCERESRESSIVGHQGGNMGQHEDFVMPTDVSQMVGLININGVTADFIEVGPWYNRMPGAGGGGGGGNQGDADSPKQDEGRNRHLVATVVMRNNNNHEVQVLLEQAFISFEKDQVGEAVTPGSLSLMDDTGMPTGKMMVMVPANEPKQLVRFRGWGLFGEGHENEMLYLTLLLKIDNQYVTVRRSGKVVAAM